MTPEEILINYRNKSIKGKRYIETIKISLYFYFLPFFKFFNKDLNKKDLNLIWIKQKRKEIENIQSIIYAQLLIFENRKNSFMFRNKNGRIDLSLMKMYLLNKNQK
jgi:hypothetical protein